MMWVAPPDHDWQERTESEKQEREEDTAKGK